MVGLGALFPGAPNVRAYWDNIQSGRDCIGELPDSRLDAAFVGPASRVDRIPHRRAGVIGPSVRFAAVKHGIMPVAARGAEPDQLLALAVASAAMEHAGLADTDFDRSRAGVILGRGGYLTPGLVRLNRKVREAEQLVHVLRELVPGLGAEKLEAIRARFQEQAGPFGPDTAIGLVPNLVASRIANRLDLQGPAYTIDAACASALLAVEQGVRGLQAGSLDVALVGGVHLTHDVAFHAVFAQLGAVSPSGRIRPFDQNADGLVVGEGIGMLVLMRREDAEARGLRVLCQLDGVGSSSDGRAASQMAPRVEGQLLAVQRAWKDAGRSPWIGLLEAHGTGTQAGDTAELNTLLQAFGTGPGVLGSVKSQIGHAMPAAGAAGLIKAVLAVHHGVLPPSLGVERPHPLLEGSEWRVLSKAEAWEGERVAGVNAFGFGGINAHVVLRGIGDPVPVPRPARRPADRANVDVIALAAETPEALLLALQSGQRRGGEGPCRLALVDPTPERVERARQIVERGKPWSGRRGFWFRPSGLLEEGELVFLYPGIEAEFAPQVERLAEHFGMPVPAFMEPADLEQTGRGVVGLGRLLTEVLAGLGLKPDRMAGHSIGEWSAMLAAGVLDGDEVDAFLDRVPLGGLEVPGVLFLAAGCGREQAESVTHDLDAIAVSHDNCPRQVILCGEEGPIHTARDRLIQQGVVCQILPFRSGFHSPLFAPFLGPHQAHFAELTVAEPRVPLYSATLADRFGDDVDVIRQTALDHLVQPLRWTELIRKLYDDGGRVFVQVGTGSLPNFVRDTLSERPHSVLSAIEPRRDGLVQLRNLLLGLYVEGLDALDALLGPPVPTVELQLGVPLAELGLEPVQATPTAAVPDSLKGAFDRTMAALQRGPLDVLEALAPKQVVHTRKISVHTDPLLFDHSFFPQPEGWPVLSDRRPVVPMTMLLDLLCEVALELAPGHVVTRLEGLSALQWLVVEPPVEVTLRARKEGGAIHAEIEGYASALVHVARRYAPGMPELPPLEAPGPSRITAAELYQQRWMFHGPAYQGVSDLGVLDGTGADGVITVPQGRGSLLDNAGQLLGWWLMATADADQLAMPVGMKSVSFFDVHPPVGAQVECRVRICELTERALVADLELLHGGRLWCRIERWADHRFSTDQAMWDVMRQPEHNVLATPHGRFWLLDDRTLRAPSRDWLMRRYLTESERNALQQSRQPRAFLNDRIALCDARRARAWALGAEPMFPVEAPTDGMSAVAHEGPVSVAIVSDRPVGIGISADRDRAREQAATVDGEVSDTLVGDLWVAWAENGS